MLCVILRTKSIFRVVRDMVLIMTDTVYILLYAYKSVEPCSGLAASEDLFGISGICAPYALCVLPAHLAVVIKRHHGAVVPERHGAIARSAPIEVSTCSATNHWVVAHVHESDAEAAPGFAVPGSV